MKIWFNDYELIYYYREHNYCALEILMSKYKGLIYQIIIDHNIPQRCRDDFYQEGCLCLMQALNTFSEAYGKSFTRYFELLWKRKLEAVRKSIVGDYELISEYDLLSTTKEDIVSDVIYRYNIDSNLKYMNEIEQTVYLLYFVKNFSIDSICEKTKRTKKQVYNLICKIKKMISF